MKYVLLFLVAFFLYTYCMLHLLDMLPTGVSTAIVIGKFIFVVLFMTTMFKRIFEDKHDAGCW